MLKINLWAAQPLTAVREGRYLPLSLQYSFHPLFIFLDLPM